MDQEMQVATSLDRMTFAPLIYDTFAARFTAAVPAGGIQDVTLDADDYTLFTKGHGQESESVGMTIERDGLFTNLYKDGGFDKSMDFEIWGIGLQFASIAFIGTAGLDAGAQIQGTYIALATHDEYLANLFLNQTFIQIGADQEDCEALLGPTAHWGYGSIGLGDNAVSPRLQNAITGNERLFRYAALATPIRKGKGGVDNATVRIRRSTKIALTYATTSIISAAASDVALLVNVVAFGRRVPTGE